MPKAQKLTPAIGAEISGIDLREALTDSVVRWLSDQLVAHKVLFFRDQPIDTEQHLTFARRFGELETHPVQPKAGFPESTNAGFAGAGTRSPSGTIAPHSTIDSRLLSGRANDGTRHGEG